jgi:hypothetical protein
VITALNNVGNIFSSHGIIEEQIAPIIHRSRISVAVFCCTENAISVLHALWWIVTLYVQVQKYYRQ